MLSWVDYFFGNYNLTHKANLYLIREVIKSYLMKVN